MIDVGGPLTDTGGTPNDTGDLRRTQESLLLILYALWSI